jgi:hypothetical protein
MISVENYSANAIAVFGDTKTWKNELKNLGGKYNPNLKGQPGWIFNKNQEEIVNSLVSQISNGQIQPSFQQTYQPRQPTQIPVPLNYTQNTMDGNDAFNRLKISKSSTEEKAPIKPYSNIQTIQSNVSFPNVFTAADGLTYQIIMTTTIVPSLNQKVSIVVGESSTDYKVSYVKSTYPIDIFNIKSEADDKELILNIINGVWKVASFNEAHSVVFNA